MSKTFIAAVLMIGSVTGASGQSRGIDITYGKWWHDGGTANVITASLSKRWFGPISWGIGVNHVNDKRSLVDRSVTGGELFIRLSSPFGGPFAVGAAGIGRRHDQSNLDGQWSFGVGYAHDASSFLTFTGEARYRVEDQFIRGFWALDPADRSGMTLNAGIALRFGGSGVRRPPRPTTRPPIRRPPEETTDRPEPTDVDETTERRTPALSTVGRLPRDAEALAADVVETALNVMGSPYRWGGKGENGFDCSGLIQYSYARHGIIVPRISRDQANYGEYVEPKVERLQPGDVLGFAITGGRVSHVGLYVGDGQFIHSSSTGVTLSSLTGRDGDSLYYQRRWVVARRILN